MLKTNSLQRLTQERDGAKTAKRPEPAKALIKKQESELKLEAFKNEGRLDGNHGGALALAQPYLSVGDPRKTSKQAVSSNSRSLIQSKEFSDLPKMLGSQITGKGEPAANLTQKDSSLSQLGQAPQTGQLTKGAGSGNPIFSQYMPSQQLQQVKTQKNLASLDSNSKSNDVVLMKNKFVLGGERDHPASVLKSISDDGGSRDTRLIYGQQIFYGGKLNDFPRVAAGAAGAGVSARSPNLHLPA